MVKLKGPALSIDATGSVADAVTFSKWKGRHYLKKKSFPKDALTAAQTSIRSAMTFLNERWSELTKAEKSSWATKHNEEPLPPYNNFLSINIKRFATYRPPGKELPITAVGTPPTWLLDPPPCMGGVNWFLVSAMYSVVADAWGYALFLSQDAGFTPSLQNLVKLRVHQDLTLQATEITGLAAGNWTVKLRAFTTDGKWGTSTAGSTRAVTDP